MVLRTPCCAYHLHLPTIRLRLFRHLLVPLMGAERCWAAAMEMRTQLEKEPLSYKRQHSLRRLAKAAAFAAQVQSCACYVSCKIRQDRTHTRALLYGVQESQILNMGAPGVSQLAELASARADGRTSLEAQAYALWMAGSLAFERELWETALSKLSRAK